MRPKETISPQQKILDAPTPLPRLDAIMSTPDYHHESYRKESIREIPDNLLENHWDDVFF